MGEKVIAWATILGFGIGLFYAITTPDVGPAARFWGVILVAGLFCGGANVLVWLARKLRG